MNIKLEDDETQPCEGFIGNSNSFHAFCTLFAKLCVEIE